MSGDAHHTYIPQVAAGTEWHYSELALIGIVEFCDINKWLDIVTRFGFAGLLTS
jgi:hypothetical protein